MSKHWRQKGKQQSCEIFDILDWPFMRSSVIGVESLLIPQSVCHHPECFHSYINIWVKRISLVHPPFEFKILSRSALTRIDGPGGRKAPLNPTSQFNWEVHPRKIGIKEFPI